MIIITVNNRIKILKMWVNKMKKIIFDTDIGCDCDDVGALCLLLSAEKRGHCELAAVTLSSPYETAAPCVGAILEQYGRKDVPIGSLCKPSENYYPHGDNYSAGVAEAFPSDIAPVSDAVSLIRALLVGSAEKVTLVATGPLPNINAFLSSEPDEHSPLDGVTLAMRKLDEIVIMGGWFESFEGGEQPRPEFNIVNDIAGAAGVFEKSPVPVTVLPFEAGLQVYSGSEMVKKYGHNQPSSLSYILHGSSGGRDSWDPATALYAVYGCGAELELSEPGKIRVSDDGMTNFTPDPSGKHRYLRRTVTREALAKRIDEAID